MIKQYEIINNRVIASPEGQGQIMVALAPDEGERAILKEQFHIDEYDMASTLDIDEVPRLDVSGGRLLAIWKVPDRVTVFNSIELGIKVAGVIIHSDRLIFIHTGGDMSFTEREYRNTGDIRDVMLGFLLYTVRHFVSHLKAIRQISSELEKKITVSMENRHLLQMFNLSESLVYYIDAIEGNAVVLSKFKNVCGQFGFKPHQMELLDDIILENIQAARQANIFSSVLSGLMDARGTIVNNNMNVLLKNLTLINIVFLPLNLIASIGGMSEWTMITDGIDWRISYLLFCVGMVVLGWGTWIFMKKVIDRGPKQD
jgi:magnesium transporter